MSMLYMNLNNPSPAERHFLSHFAIFIVAICQPRGSRSRDDCSGQGCARV